MPPNLGSKIIQTDQRSILEDSFLFLFIIELIQWELFFAKEKRNAKKNERSNLQLANEAAAAATDEKNE